MTKYNYLLQLEMRGGERKKDIIRFYFEHINTVKTKTKSSSLRIP